MLYLLYFSYFSHISENTEVAYLTRAVVLVNADCYTAWNIRFVGI